MYSLLILVIQVLVITRKYNILNEPNENLFGFNMFGNIQGYM